MPSFIGYAIAFNDLTYKFFKSVTEEKRSHYARSEDFIIAKKRNLLKLHFDVRQMGFKLI